MNIVMEPEAYSGPVCRLDSVQCRCEDALGGDIGSVARDADMTLLDGQPIFVSFDSFYGDLVLITGANNTRWQ